jgi:hypothetical protein
MNRKIKYRVKLGYSYDEENDRPLMPPAVEQLLADNLANALEHCRQEGMLGTDEISCDWIEVV